MTGLHRAVQIAVVVAALTAPPAFAAPPIFGRWLTDDRSAVVRIGHCGAKLCGVIERVLDRRAPARDINNSDAALRHRALVGTPVLYGFTGSGRRWSDGRAYDPKGGRSYRSKLEVLANGKLKVTGCVLVVCRSKVWTRAN